MATLACQQQFVEAIQDGLVRLRKGCSAEALPILAQLQGVLEQVDKRLNEGTHRLPGQFLAQLGQLTEQVNQAALLRTGQTVVGRVEITDERAGKGGPQ